ncbi:hypothetical protein ACOSQ2_000026 [Xanthoceras sorbifolium]
MLATALSLLLLTWMYEICVWIHQLLLWTLGFSNGNAEQNIINNPLVYDDFDRLWALKREREEAIKKLAPPEKYDCGLISKNNTTASNNNCAICLEEFVSGDLCRVLPLCKHIYHFQCINSWLLDELSCPICRCSVIESTQT